MTYKLQSFILLIILSLSINLTYSQTVYINEIHYDNDGADSGEAFEIAGPEGTDLSDFSVVLYNGSNGEAYATIPLSGTIPNQQGEYGTLSFNQSGIQNGSPDGIALVNSGTLIQFLSYEGSFTAIGGAADGIMSTDIGVVEGSSTPVGNSMQLTGVGQIYTDFSWSTEIAETFGSINEGQDFGGEVVDPDPDPDPETSNALVYINEFHYDNSGTDNNEGIEIAGLAGTDLEGYSLLLYNGSNGSIYNTIELGGVLDNQQNGFGTTSVLLPSNGLQNGSPDGIALVGPEGLIQFLSYEGTFMAVGGEADGMLSVDIAIAESSGTPEGWSLQLIGEGTYFEDFIWEAAPNTFSQPNEGQTFVLPDPVVFINEIHYDNASTDSGEGIEIAGTAGTDLEGYILVLYNGSNGSEYNTIALSGLIPEQQNGFGTIAFLLPSNGLQNGSPDGLALVNASNEVIQFLSYEGSFTAIGGAADGITSTDILVSEGGDTPVGFSLQLGGEGQAYEDFTWQTPISNTFNEINSNQSFGGEDPDPEDLEKSTIAEARLLPQGTEVWIEGILTVSSQFGNTAYIQDETGGLAVFGEMVTEEGMYEIGDKLKLIGFMSSFNELIQISNLETVELLDTDLDVNPIEITADQLENYRGQLVKLLDVTFLGNDPILFGNSNFDITDGTAEVELRIDGDVEDLVGKTQPEFCYEVIGVVGRFRDFNQLLPRMQSDLPCAEDYNPDNTGFDISQDLTLEVVTWNIEWFGSSSNSPANQYPDSDSVQKEAVKTVLTGLNADVIAVQEITDETLFSEMINELDGYSYVLSEGVSYPNDLSGESQKIGLIYKNETLEITNTEVLFTSIHPYYNGGDDSFLTDYPVADRTRFFASGRLPYLVEANVMVQNQSEKVNFVVLHARANTGSDQDIDYAMRRYDVELLKDSLDVNYPKTNLLILGDYNDDVDATVADGVPTMQSSYFEYVNDTDDYKVLTKSLSENGFRSTVSFTDMIDHISVSDELFDNYVEGSETVHYEYYSSQYDSTTSDHFPVSVRLVVISEDNSCGESGEKVLLCYDGNAICVSKSAVKEFLMKGAVMGSCEEDRLSLTIYPNPASNDINLTIDGFTKGKAMLSIVDLNGLEQYSSEIVLESGVNNYPLDISFLTTGIYIVKVQNNKGDSFYTKLIVL